MASYFTIRWQDGMVQMIDQRLLPLEIQYRNYDSYLGVAEAIRDMVIRGAPAIGAAAAYGLALAALKSPAQNLPAVKQDMEIAAEVLLKSRPTAINLYWAVKRVVQYLSDPHLVTIEAFKRSPIPSTRSSRRLRSGASEPSSVTWPTRTS